MKKEQVLAKLRSCGLVAVVRAKDADDAMRIAEACIEGGCAGIELTYTTPGVNAIIEKMAREYDGTDFVIGAGTVMDPETARMAILSGAQYVVSPYFNGDTVRLCNRYRVACMPGAMSIAEHGRLRYNLSEEALIQTMTELLQTPEDGSLARRLKKVFRK